MFYLTHYKSFYMQTIFRANHSTGAKEKLYVYKRNLNLTKLNSAFRHLLCHPTGK